MANDRVSIDYNDELKPLEAVLASVKRAGDFVTHGRIELPMPKVEVERVGVLSFPVPQLQTSALIEQAARAPFGRGEETVLDLSVRKVWQVPADKVRIGGKSWAANFDGIMGKVAAGLGCERGAISAELYKLLIYDEGGFFRAHRDTEKAGGMFGTLVVVLPSIHRGGELLVRHVGREVAVDLSGAEVSEIAFAGFYADCEHEVRPVAAGHRVCLVYNLIQTRGGRTAAAALTAPDYAPQVAQAAELLGNALGGGKTTKVAWLLEHHYSPAALAFSALKSADAARAKLLIEAAERAHCAAHLAIVHIEESGSAEPGYSHYEDRYEDEDAGEGSNDEFDIIEITDSWHYVDQWVDAQDSPVAFGKLPLLDGELLPQNALDNEKPDQQRLMEATGNEGSSFERAYHRAAVVIWHRDRYADVLLQAGVGAALPWLKERIAVCAGEAAGSTARRATAALAQRMIAQWIGAPGSEFHHYHETGRPADRAEMLELIGRLGDAALLEEFVEKIVTRDYDGSENAALVAYLPLLAPAGFGEVVSNFLRQAMPRSPGPCVELLQGLIPDDSSTRGAALAAAFRKMAESAVAALDHVTASKSALPLTGRIAGSWARSEIDRQLADINEENDEQAIVPPHRPIDAGFVVNLLTVLGRLEAAEAAAGKIAARPTVFDPVKLVVPALDTLRGKGRTYGSRDADAALDHLWRQCSEFLLRRSEYPPEPPKNWRLESTLSCRCADCRELQAFARDQVERVHRFRVRQDRRQHLHTAIEQQGLEMTHVTERKGSPQTLVCTKDRRGYRRRCAQYKDDIAALATLAGMADQGAAYTASLKRIADARAHHASWSQA